MPLSEHEQRMLDEIERALYAEDPKFASTVRGAKARTPSRRRRIQGLAVFIVGVALLVVGVILPLRVAEVPILSVVGFLVMFSGALLAVLGGRGKQGETGGSNGDDPDDGGAPGRSSFTQRMEDRFRRRFEQ